MSQDTVTLDHSFLLRLMELMREDQEISDVKLHELADRIIEIGKTDIVTMEHYDNIVFDLDPSKAGYNKNYDSSSVMEEIKRLSGIKNNHSF